MRMRMRNKRVFNVNKLVIYINFWQRKEPYFIFESMNLRYFYVSFAVF